MAKATRSSFYSYLYTMYRIVPQPAPSMEAFTALVMEYRAGAPVHRELLAAIAPILGGLARLYQEEGALVSDFWEVAQKKHTPKDIGAAIRDIKKIEIKGDQRRARRHDDYQQVELGERAHLRELLPGWFLALPNQVQAYLWETVMEEETSAERAERLETNESTERSTRFRLFADLRKKLATDFPSMVPLPNEPRAKQTKPSARGSRK